MGAAGLNLRPLGCKATRRHAYCHLPATTASNGRSPEHSSYSVGLPFAPRTAPQQGHQRRFTTLGVRLPLYPSLPGRPYRVESSQLRRCLASRCHEVINCRARMPVAGLQPRCALLPPRGVEPPDQRSGFHAGFHGQMSCAARRSLILCRHRRHRSTHRPSGNHIDRPTTDLRGSSHGDDSTAVETPCG